MNRRYLSRLRSFGLVVIVALATGCVGTAENSIRPPSSATSTFSTPPIESSSFAAEVISPVPDSTAALAAIDPEWEMKANWTPANQIRTVLVAQSGDLWTGGPAGVVHWDLKTNTPTVYAIRRKPENTNVLALSQTSDGAIWAGTFGNGLARFDGKNWQAFTMKDGLPGDYIISQTTTSQGDLWFTTQKDQYRGDQDWGKSSHFLHFDGANWIIEKGIAFDRLVTLPDDSIVSVYNEPPGGARFNSQIGIFNGQSWNRMDIYPGEWVDAIMVDPGGVMWLATRDTIYRYENQIWKEIIPPWAGKDFPEVSSIAVSKDGLAWFGFSRRTAFDIDTCGDRSDSYEEQGVYRYDGKSWIHFTTEDGLVDNKICAVSSDSSGNVWFGSFDKGVSRFDGHNWTSYIVP